LHAAVLMPRRSLERGYTVSDLAPGESAYVPPSALLVSAARACHLQTDIPTRRNPDEIASMHVTRTPDGFVADVTYCHYAWDTIDWADAMPHAPVVRVVYGDEFLQ
jgi:hypothetical protein